MPSWKILQGNCLQVLRQLPDTSVQTLVTSPPYYGLRDYGGDPFVWGGMPSCIHEWGEELPGSNRGGSGTPTNKNNRGEGYGRDAARGAFCQRTGCNAWNGSLGLEPTPELFVQHLVMIFREARRVLRADGTAWINMGDSYATETRGEVKHKDLIGVPWMMAFALRADGWYLRSEIIWAKPRPMPESIQDRPTKAHEHIFLLAKSERYFYDLEAIREEPKPENAGKMSAPKCGENRLDVGARDQNTKQYDEIKGANARDVWTIATEPFVGAHFAVFPPKLPERCILAGTSEKGACAKCGAPVARTKIDGSDYDDSRRQTKRALEIAEEQGLTEEHLAAIRSAGINDTGKIKVTQNAKIGEATARLAAEAKEKLGGYYRELIVSKKQDRWGPTCSCGTDDRQPCIVLDIFNGSGTTGEAALKNGRNYIGIEQNPEFIKVAKARLIGTAKEDMRAGDFVFCPTCEAKGMTKLFERAAVEKSRAEGKKITCPKCLGRYTAEALGVLA
jgi:DNA modification methylase